ncbi:hypothetical protein QZH46_17520 [Pseudomonas corrugata]
MELLLETVALYCLKLVYEAKDHSPILRDDPLMADYEREVFGLMVRKGDIEGVRGKVEHCLGLALQAVGGANTVLGHELNRLAADFSAAQTIEQFDHPLTTLKGYLKDIQ